MSKSDERFGALHSQLRTIAVTGTNGKTSTTAMVGTIIASSGEPWAMATTLGGWVNGKPIAAKDEQGRPASPTSLLTFLATVDVAVKHGVKTLSLEMTSLALSRGAALRWPAQIAVFTNISRDHLDVHESPEAYLAAKAQLFLNLPAGGAAILNADDPSSALLQEVLPQGVRCLTFSTRAGTGADLAVVEVKAQLGKTQLRLEDSELGRALGLELTLKTTGEVHAANALGAALAAWSAGYDADTIKRGLSRFSGVPGRFELVRPAPTLDTSALPTVIVDYAHTPDGLVGTLSTARGLITPQGRLILVFGCGGERDQGKRPLMAQRADEACELVILTSDNPRREPLAQINAQILAGVPAPKAQWHTEPDRAAAIALALKLASPQDMIIIAGKGHERTQRLADKVVPFSDVEVAKALLNEHG